MCNTLWQWVVILKVIHNLLYFLYVGPSNLIFSIYLCWIYASNISHMQAAQFQYCHSYIGCQMDFVTSRHRWMELLISLNHSDISKSKYHSVIGKSNYRCRGTYIVYNESLGINNTSEPTDAYGLVPVWHQAIGIHHGGPWQPVIKTVHTAKNHSHASGREPRATG